MTYNETVTLGGVSAVYVPLEGAGTIIHVPTTTTSVQWKINRLDVRARPEQTS